MSYRAFKRLLGETSLERKCRFLFGSGVIVLVTLSFWLYSSLLRLPVRLLTQPLQAKLTRCMPGLRVTIRPRWRAGSRIVSLRCKRIWTSCWRQRGHAQ